MSHPRCVYINNRCGYQSVTQQYLKGYLIKDELNYMFRPNVAIIRFTSDSMVVVLYRIGKSCKALPTPIGERMFTVLEFAAFKTERSTQ